MTDPNAPVTAYSRALPEAMGYTVTMDDSAGYGVTRMLVSRADKPYVEPTWNPRQNSAQCFEVLCWLMGRVCIDTHSPKCQPHYVGAIPAEGRTSMFDVSGWPDYEPVEITDERSLRAAIVEAAERVAMESAK